KALAAAQARLDDVRANPDTNQLRAAEAGVRAAGADRDAAQAQLELTQAGPTEEEVAVAEVDVARARVALEMARAALADTEVRAPFAGTVTAVPVQVGNAVMPGQVACTLATVDQLQVRTKDLSELDVAGIQPGQSVKVTVDALPEQEFDGIVREVALQAEDFRGEAVFAVTVDLVDVGGAPLRWGMTAWVEFAGP
ncbi:MAG: efflux RND transporter periplasmic adaptor subunit, partial [Anaerolineae bacterium]